MLRKIRLRRIGRATDLKLWVVCAPWLPVVTWNTGSISDVATKRMARVRRWDWRAVLAGVICVALALVIVAAIVLGLWLASRYAML